MWAVCTTDIEVAYEGCGAGRRVLHETLYHIIGVYTLVKQHSSLGCPRDSGSKGQGNIFVVLLLKAFGDLLVYVVAKLTMSRCPANHHVVHLKTD